MKFNLTSILSCLINCLIPKRERFVFGITYYKESKTGSSVFHAEETNISTVATINQMGDNFSLNSELVFLRHF